MITRKRKYDIIALCLLIGATAINLGYWWDMIQPEPEQTGSGVAFVSAGVGLICFMLTSVSSYILCWIVAMRLYRRKDITK